MTLLPFLVLAFGAGALSLLTRPTPRASIGIGLVGLVLAGMAAGAIRDEAPFLIAGGSLAGTDFARLYLTLGCIVGLLLSIVALATTWPRSLPGASLIGLGAAGLALGLADAGTAVAATTGGAVVGILVTVAAPTSERGLIVSIRELRAVVVAGTLALAGAAVVAGPLGGLRVDPAILGIAYLAFVLAVAIRLGAIPFHVWAARVADAAPALGLPLVMAWGPAAFTVVALTWIDGAIAPMGAPLGAERGLVALVGLASIALGTAAAIAHDDLEHVVGYSIVADAGVALLGLAALDPAAWAPTRTWLLAFVVTKSAFAAWAAAILSRYGTRRLSELGGWARRSPMLLVALMAIAVATIGWPGLAAFAARGSLIDLVLDGPLALFTLVASLAGVVVYGRVLLAGLAPPGHAVDAAAAGRPSRPAGRPRGPSPSLHGDAIDAWIANRGLIAAAGVLALSGLALAVAGGGLGVADAAAGLPPGAGQPTESFGPEPSDAPGGSPGQSGSPEASGPSASGEPAESTAPTGSVPASP